MEAAANQQLQAQLDDNNYDETQLIDLKVPITHLSYYQNSKEFESVAGKIEIRGVLYSYVKRRIYNDSLEVLCIPDLMAMQFRAAKNEFFLSANGLQHPDQGKKQTANTGASRVLFADYYPPQDITMTGAAYTILFKRYGDDLLPVHSSYSFAPEHPPKMADAIV